MPLVVVLEVSWGVALVVVLRFVVAAGLAAPLVSFGMYRNPRKMLGCLESK